MATSREQNPRRGAQFFRRLLGRHTWHWSLYKKSLENDARKRPDSRSRIPPFGHAGGLAAPTGVLSTIAKGG